MSTLHFVLGDQLSQVVLPLSRELVARGDSVLMAEVREEGSYVAQHGQKIVMVLAAMREFAAKLRSEGVDVDYVTLDAPENTGTLAGELERAVQRRRPDRVVLVEPGEWRVERALRECLERSGIAFEIREDPRFFLSRAEFAKWAQGRSRTTLEMFYRFMRRRTGILMRGDAPVGGRWNFDPLNRKPLPADVMPPVRLRFPPTPSTRQVMDLVRREFPSHFGTIDAFAWPVTRAQALQALEHFIAKALPAFGDYQDAMRQGAPFLYHSLIAPALNVGLLEPREVCAAAEDAYEDGAAPLHAVEGFIRQILGWREYVRGTYWLRMPDYANVNALGATRPLPSFYWDGETPMNCIGEVVRSTRQFAYSHHIQRLMITGNFALLAGIRPQEVERWYLGVYADAVEWVEMANTLGMALHADGGALASKPYAASGAYINRMSDFCGACSFDVRLRTGPRACPFNALYWRFLMQHETIFKRNPRMAMPYRTLARWSAQERDAIRDSADRFLESLAPTPETVAA